MRILAIIFALFITLGVIGQTRGDASSERDAVVNLAKSSHYHVGTSAQLTSATDSTWEYVIFNNTHDELVFDVDMDVDSVGGTAGVANQQYFWLSYKNLPNESYTAIGDSAKYAGNVDTTFTLTSGATAVKARYVKINCLGELSALYTQLGDFLYKHYK